MMNAEEKLKSLPLSIPLSVATAGTVVTGFVFKRLHSAFGIALTALSLLHGWQHYKKMQWDIERMADCASNFSAVGRTADDEKETALQTLLDSMEIASFVPGRLRVRTPMFVGNDALTAQLTEYVKSFRGVSSVETSTITGSMLIVYKPEEIRKVPGLRQLEETVAALAE